MKFGNSDATGGVEITIKKPMDMFTKQRLWDAFEETHLLLMEIREFCEKKEKGEVITCTEIIEIIDKGLE